VIRTALIEAILSAPAVKVVRVPTYLEPGYLRILQERKARGWRGGRFSSSARWLLWFRSSNSSVVRRGPSGLADRSGARWGALVGRLAGLFFMPIGLIVGPLAGAYGFEMAFAKKESNPAMISGMGSVAGTVVGMVVKIFFGVLMVAWFLLDVFLIG
jgi:hypothetical protein